MNLSSIIKSPLFKGLPCEEVRALLKQCPHHIQVYDKGEVIFHQMDEAKKIGLVLEGKVQGMKLFPKGSAVNVASRLQGDLFGPAAAFSTYQSYPCDVVAIEASSILMFYKKDFLLMLQKNSKILENVLAEISTIVTLLQERLELHSYSGIGQKIAFWLLMQQRKTGHRKIHLSMSITQWAAFMNVSRPSLHREIKALERQGLIQYGTRKITILDTQGLEDLLNG